MLRKRIELTNERFGKLTVKERAEDRLKPCGKKEARWKCICDCGKEKIVSQTHLRSGITISCGCHGKNLIKERNLKHGYAKKNKKAKEYRTWMAMRSRCNNPNTQFYSRYGERGIKVCNEWDNFEIFLKDMGPAPSEKHSIERRNNDLGYNPQNCYWATNYEQSINKSIGKNNTSGHKNIVIVQNKNKVKYRIQIKRKEERYIKTCETLEEAIASRDAWLSNYEKNRIKSCISTN